MPGELTPQERKEILGTLTRAFDDTSAEVLIDAMDRVAAHRAQAIILEGFQELKAIIATLAQAQARTEQALNELSQAQARSEARI
ncbi:MAG: hypothetical protein RMM98_04065 [Acidobacteriota bacterium]|nr:hypothetical protein [Acidobacteriota bacterium]